MGVFISKSTENIEILLILDVLETAGNETYFYNSFD
jgi:hypothetical protein